MIRIIVILAAFGHSSCRPQFEVAAPTIIDYINHIGPYGYYFKYLTSDGIGREESGELQYPGTPEENYIVQGRTSWTSPEGISYVVTFVSDKNGYRLTNPEEYGSYIPSIYYPGPSSSGVLGPNRLTDRPVKIYVPPPKSTTFGPVGDRLPIDQQYKGVVPVTGGRVGITTGLALTGLR